MLKSKISLICWITFLLLALILLVVSTTYGSRDITKSQVTFSHKLHTDNEVECKTCHIDITKSNQSKDNNLPDKKICLDCHDEKDFSGSMPKIKYDRKYVTATQADYPVKFSHKKHLDKFFDCLKCHLSFRRVTEEQKHIPESNKVADNKLPSMTVCNECHKVNTGKCNTCHLTLGSDKYIPASHDKTLWIKWHKEQAEHNDKLCADCHKGDIRVNSSQKVLSGPGHNLEGKAKECAECHKGDVRPNQHGNNYILIHGVDAKVDSEKCIVCHKRSECRECHKATDFNTKMHSSEWINGGHSRQARNNLNSCVSCHDEQTCISCHSSISPHPKNWKLKITSGNARQHKDPTVCFKCHEREELCNRCHDLERD
mgnify:CR=1 FL=1